MSITPRHNELWPQGYVTIFCASALEDRLGLFFGALEQAKAALRKMHQEDIQYVCFNSLDFSRVEAIFRDFSRTEAIFRDPEIQE